MNEAAEAGEELFGELLLATDTQIEHRVRVGPVANIDPRVRGAPRVEQDKGRVIGVQRERGFHAAAHEVVEFAIIEEKLNQGTARRFGNKVKDIFS